MVTPIHSLEVVTAPLRQEEQEKLIPQELSRILSTAQRKAVDARIQDNARLSKVLTAAMTDPRSADTMALETMDIYKQAAVLLPTLRGSGALRTCLTISEMQCVTVIDVIGL